MPLFLLLIACTQAPAQQPLDQKPIDLDGSWMQIESPPGHQEQDCWVWKHTNLNNAAASFGGPVCLPMGD